MEPSKFIVDLPDFSGDEPYEKVNKTINEWPNWKKDAYNKMFAVSAHAEKIIVEQ